MRFRLKMNPLFLAGSLLMDVLSFVLLLRCLLVYNAVLFGAGLVCFGLGSFVFMPLWMGAFAQTDKNALRIRKGIFIRISIPYASIAAVHPHDDGLSIEFTKCGTTRRLSLRVVDEVIFLRALRDKIAQV